MLATVESVRRVTRTLDGEVSASAMLERFGFTGDRLTARLGDLSGGERRRFQLLMLLLTEPNVLLLDEPTNDLDIETLNVLEDFLDDWPGTLVVVSHDRYFLERVCDTTWALLGDGQVSLLPRGVDEYLERRAARLAADRAAAEAAALVRRPHRRRRRREGRRGSAAEREARKTLARLDRQLARVAEREAEISARWRRPPTTTSASPTSPPSTPSSPPSARCSRPSGSRPPRSSSSRTGATSPPSGRNFTAERGATVTAERCAPVTAERPQMCQSCARSAVKVASGRRWRSGEGREQRAEQVGEPGAVLGRQAGEQLALGVEQGGEGAVDGAACRRG